MRRTQLDMPEPFDVTQIDEDAHDAAGTRAGPERSPVRPDPLRDLRRLASRPANPPDPVQEAQATAASDPVNHPIHYVSHPSGVECIIITEWMNFNLGNAVKYIWRANDKGSTIQDLEKARWYLDREISRLNRLKDTA